MRIYLVIALLVLVAAAAVKGRRLRCPRRGASSASYCHICKPQQVCHKYTSCVRVPPPPPPPAPALAPERPFRLHFCRTVYRRRRYCRPRMLRRLRRRCICCLRPRSRRCPRRRRCSLVCRAYRRCLRRICRPVDFNEKFNCEVKSRCIQVSSQFCRPAIVCPSCSA